MHMVCTHFIYFLIFLKRKTFRGETLNIKEYKVSVQTLSPSLRSPKVLPHPDKHLHLPTPL